MRTLRELLIQTLPWRSADELVSVEYVQIDEELRGDVEIAAHHPTIELRLVVWKIHPNTGMRFIEDVKEQVIQLPALVGEGESREIRLRAFVRALRHVAIKILNAQRDASGGIRAWRAAESMLPKDFCEWSPLRLKMGRLADSRSEDELFTAFVEALQARSRLGKYL